MGSEAISHAFNGSGPHAHGNGAGGPNHAGAPNHMSASNVRELRPAAGDVRLTVPARPENVAVVRHVLGAFAEALRLPAALVEDIRLAATEACTNVVRHAYRDGEPGPIDVAIRPAGDRLDVVVTDRGRGVGASPDLAGPGLGLPLISALADSVEFRHAPRRGSRLSMSFACHQRTATG